MEITIIIKLEKFKTQNINPVVSNSYNIKLGENLKHYQSHFR